MVKDEKVLKVEEEVVNTGGKDLNFMKKVVEVEEKAELSRRRLWDVK